MNKHVFSRRLLIIMVAMASIIFAGCAITQTDRIKQKVWHDMGEGARVSVDGNWWNGSIELVDPNIDLKNPGLDIQHLDEFKKKLDENNLYIVTWIGNKRTGNAGTKKIFADNEGNILGYDSSHIPQIEGGSK